MEEFKITKERILKAANSCSTTKRALEILFPEAFEEEMIYLKGGTIFEIVDTNIASKFLNISYIDRRAEGSMYTPDKIQINRLIILIHEINSHQYRFVHLGTGYRWNGKIYYRKGKGIQVPKEDMIGTKMICEGQGK